MIVSDMLVLVVQLVVAEAINTCRWMIYLANLAMFSEVLSVVVDLAVLVAEAKGEDV